MNNELPYKCNAKTRNGGNCQRRPSQNGRCRLHGGASLAGIASPRFKHGKFSKYVPEHLAKRQAGLEENEILNQHRQNIALVNARMEDLLRGLDVGEFITDFNKLRRKLASLENALINENIEKAKLDLIECKAIVGAGKTETETWREIVALVEQSRRLVESEAKQYKTFSQILTVEQANVFVSRLAMAVKKHVRDEDTMRAISEELVKLLNHRNER
jgi:hypothetical protein